jgi:hypothetical protein
MQAIDVVDVCRKDFILLLELIDQSALTDVGLLPICVEGLLAGVDVSFGILKL